MAQPTLSYPVALLVDRQTAIPASDRPLHVISLDDERFLSARVLFATASRFLREPLRVLRHFSPRAIYLAQTLRQRGITEVRAADERLQSAVTTIESLIGAPPLDLSFLDLDWTPLGARSLGIRWISSRLDAAVAEVVIDGVRDVIVKQHRTEPVGERARHEVSTLERLPNVPRVLLFDERRATIVMERAPGVSLDRLFARAEPDRLLPALERAGAWLREMQNATRGADDGTAVLRDVLATAVKDANGDARILRALERRIGDQPVVGHHGDYWPGNIFVEGERVTVIDFEGFREGLPLEDVAYFLIRVELLARRFRVRIPGLGEAFLRGYGELDREVLRLFTITKGLRTLANDTGGDLPLPQRLWMRNVIRGTIRRAIC
ncbi:MAG: aminoglycoside phosphotransferase family protein [Thermoanaerobaculia bacterium]